MTLELLAVILAPSIIVFLAGCALAVARTWVPPRVQARFRQRGRAL